MAIASEQSPSRISPPMDPRAYTELAHRLQAKLTGIKLRSLYGFDALKLNRVEFAKATRLLPHFGCATVTHRKRRMEGGENSDKDANGQKTKNAPAWTFVVVFDGRDAMLKPPFHLDPRCDTCEARKIFGCVQIDEATGQYTIPRTGDFQPSLPLLLG